MDGAKLVTPRGLDGVRVASTRRAGDLGCQQPDPCSPQSGAEAHVEERGQVQRRDG